jgi:hypothetical protein
MQRFVWDMHYAPPEGSRAEFPIAAIDHDTPRLPLGPWVLPGKYTLRLTVGGHSFMQPLKIKMDPRVKTPPAGLKQQFTLSMQAYEGVNLIHGIQAHIASMKKQVQDLLGRAGQGATADALTSFNQEIVSIEGGGGGRRFMRRVGGAAAPTFSRLSGEMEGLMDLFQGADAAPTTQGVAAMQAANKNLTELMERWNTIEKKHLRKLNEQVRKAGLPEIVLN